jgi:GDPmannose 4,6-dehydratase
MPRALVTGITGQDGSHLAELLLSKGYDVFGLLRGQNNPKLEQVQRAMPEVEIVEGDLTDLSSLVAAVELTQPDEVYNLGAISFVALSFKQPELTANVSGLGVLRLLEAVRIVGGQDNPIRFYQASSSEMFGKVRETPQNEGTAFHPRSPYGVAKVFGHYTTVNYRESYGLHATSGILFNHESIASHVPILVRKDGYIDIAPIGEQIPHGSDPASGTRYSTDGGGLQVWDGTEFSSCFARTAYWHQGESVVVHGQAGVIETTPDHVLFTAQGEKPAAGVEPGDRLLLGQQAKSPLLTTMTEEEACLLGILARGGHISRDANLGRVVCVDEGVLSEAATCWERVSAGIARKAKASPAISAAATGGAPAVELRGNRPYLRMLRAELYTRDGQTRVPKRILNAAPDLQLAFLRACNLCDCEGSGFGSFRTTSPTLAAGLIWLARTVLGRGVRVELRPAASGGRSHYDIALPSGRRPDSQGLEDEVRLVERRSFRGWMCDLATESGRYQAGVGFGVVHNSERRGLEFVTRKVTHAVARIKLGLQDKIVIGNLEFQRDWGYAPDYVDAMWRMLQQNEPDDYVIATGTPHSGRDLLDAAFAEIGISDWKPYVTQDQRFYRPAEVDVLVGDSSKAREKLGWQPTTDFKEMICRMVRHDLELAARDRD